MSITKGYTFGATELVTNTKLHLLVDDATISAITEAELDITSAPVTDYVMRYDGSKLDWVAQQSLVSIGGKSEIAFIVDGGGSDITVGIKGDIEVPFNCKINKSTMLANATGMAQVDIWKDTYTNYPPTVANTISSPKLIFTDQMKYQDSSLASWTTDLTAGDILRYNIESLASINRLGIYLEVLK